MTSSDTTRAATRGSRQPKVRGALRRFVEHNRRVFPQPASAPQRTPEVLFELTTMQSAHIAYSYLANVLAEDEQARIVAYLPRPLRGIWKTVDFGLKRTLGADQFGVFRSFGTSDFFTVSPSAAQKARAAEICKEIVPRLGSKADVERLTIDGAWIGDLVYDNYLRATRTPTIDIAAPDFLQSLRRFIETVVFWQDYLDSHDVRAINVSHCVYDFAVPLRLALKRDIPVFQATPTHVYRMSGENPTAYNDFRQFRERFAALPEDVQEAGLAKAERQLARRFAGEVGVDMAYSSKSAYGAVSDERLLAESPRKKILIATHCFFDSPHPYGLNLFPDFYEWLHFLGGLTEETDYDWYIKTHPDFLPGNREIIQDFLDRYPKFTLLPASSSHHQIIAEGIDVALTVYGTIGFEYAALGVPVINASRNNPHIAYDFNLHPENVDDYRRLLTNLDAIDLKIDRRQIHEYYFMRFIYNSVDLFFRDYAAMEKGLGGYFGQFSQKVYDRWLEEFSPDRHDEIRAALRRFVQSGDFRMDHSHFGRHVTVESMGIEP